VVNEEDIRILLPVYYLTTMFLNYYVNRVHLTQSLGIRNLLQPVS
jgi:hypothetical protein